MAAPAPSRRPRLVLLWLAGALGDVLLGYPALAALRAWAPGARIVVVGRAANLAFAQQAGLIDAVIEVDGPVAAALYAGRAPDLLPIPDLAVLWSSSHRLLASACQRLGVTSILAAPARPIEPRHQARYLLDCLSPLGIPRALRPAPTPHLGAPSQDLRLLLGRPGRPLVLLHPGAGAAWKRWPLSRFLELAALVRQAGAEVRWSCGPADDALRRELPALAPHEAAYLWPQLDLAIFATLLARCDLLVAPDTGVAHLAALLQVPQMTLFGPTDPHRWRPLSRTARILRAPISCAGAWGPVGEGEATDLSLRRCPPELGARCACLAALTTAPVLEACLSLLSQVHNLEPPARVPGP